MKDESLESWREGPAERAILTFVEDSAAVAIEERVAVFDNDGWKAAYERDYGWLGALMTEHYDVDDFPRTARRPTLGRRYVECGYTPMVELLAYLATNGFSNYIAYTSGAEQAIAAADDQGWTVVSVRNDWTTGVAGVGSVRWP